MHLNNKINLSTPENNNIKHNAITNEWKSWDTPPFNSLNPFGWNKLSFPRMLFLVYAKNELVSCQKSWSLSVFSLTFMFPLLTPLVNLKLEQSLSGEADIYLVWVTWVTCLTMGYTLLWIPQKHLSQWASSDWLVIVRSPLIASPSKKGCRHLTPVTKRTRFTKVS